MSKQAKTAKSVPSYYEGLPQAPDLKCCIVEDVHLGLYIFDKPEACHILAKAIQKKWRNFSHFCEETIQTMLAYHENVFTNNTPDKSLSHEEVALWVWKKFLTIGVDRRTTETLTAASGRKSTIGNTEYFLGSNEGPGQLKTPQANACLKLFRECVNASELTKIPENAPADSTPLKYITESTLRQYIIDHAGELKTRQDPWRIFQYYRPKLIEEKLLRRI